MEDYPTLKPVSMSNNVSSEETHEESSNKK